MCDFALGHGNNGKIEFDFDAANCAKSKGYE